MSASNDTRSARSRPSVNEIRTTSDVLFVSLDVEFFSECRPTIAVEQHSIIRPHFEARGFLIAIGNSPDCAHDNPISSIS